MIRLENTSFDHCIKCTVCTAYCPVSRVTHLFPGPKQSGPDTERLRIKNPGLVDESLHYCTNCKRCEIACPSDVRIADIIQRAKARYGTRHKRFRAIILSHMDLMGRMATLASAPVNLLLSLRVVRYLMEIFTGIYARREFPPFRQGTFRRWYARGVPDQSGFPVKVLFFHGCSVNHMDHDLGKDLVKLMNEFQTGVLLPDQKCCGVPAIANSELGLAEKNALFNIDSLKNAGNDEKIILTCISGAFALKHEYRDLLGLDNSAIFERVRYVTRHLYELIREGIKPHFQPLNIRAAYHSPCHLERMGGVPYTIELLKQIPGLDLVILHSECCGLSGTYGFKKEYYGISLEIGENLAKLIDNANPEIVITDCVTCKWQIEHCTTYPVLHPVTLLVRSIEGSLRPGDIHTRS